MNETLPQPTKLTTTVELALEKELGRAVYWTQRIRVIKAEKRPVQKSGHNKVEIEVASESSVQPVLQKSYSLDKSRSVSYSWR